MSEGGMDETNETKITWAYTLSEEESGFYRTYAVVETDLHHRLITRVQSFDDPRIKAIYYVFEPVLWGMGTSFSTHQLQSEVLDQCERFRALPPLLRLVHELKRPKNDG